MRPLLALLIMCLANLAYPDTIQCYSNGRMIYKGYGTHFSYEDGYIAFIERKTGDVIFANGECLIRVDGLKLRPSSKNYH